MLVVTPSLFEEVPETEEVSLDCVPELEVVVVVPSLFPDVPEMVVLPEVLPVVPEVVIPSSFPDDPVATVVPLLEEPEAVIVPSLPLLEEEVPVTVDTPSPLLEVADTDESARVIPSSFPELAAICACAPWVKLNARSILIASAICMRFAHVCIAMDLKTFKYSTLHQVAKVHGACFFTPLISRILSAPHCKRT